MAFTGPLYRARRAEALPPAAGCRAPRSEAPLPAAPGKMRGRRRRAGGGEPPPTPPGSFGAESAGPFPSSKRATAASPAAAAAAAAAAAQQPQLPLRRAEGWPRGSRWRRGGAAVRLPSGSGSAPPTGSGPKARPREVREAPAKPIPYPRACLAHLGRAGPAPDRGTGSAPPRSSHLPPHRATLRRATGPAAYGPAAAHVVRLTALC